MSKSSIQLATSSFTKSKVILLFMQPQEELEQAIKESETRLMILDFFADWCGPCKRVAPELDKICEEWEDVLFIKLNVDELESAAETYAIAAMPTFIAFKGGEKVDEVVGANLDKLREMIEKYK
uniref:Thioredoxin n=1 Tax=Schistosoma haematobium TaxID=6185 RepID=A0A095BYQ0_SCHHA